MQFYSSCFPPWPCVIPKIVLSCTSRFQYTWLTNTAWCVLVFRERELAAVKINAADVDIIANELEVSFPIFPRVLTCFHEVISAYSAF